MKGLVAGLLASIILAALSFVDYGSGNSLASVAGWLGLGGTGAARWIGFLLLLVLGGLFGTIFGIFQGRRHQHTQITLGESLTAGLTVGLIYWVIIRLLIGTFINHQQLDLTGFLYSFVPLLVYGILLGTISFQQVARKVA